MERILKDKNFILLLLHFLLLFLQSNQINSSPIVSDDQSSGQVGPFEEQSQDQDRFSSPVSTLCSLFQTFLDAKSVNCQISRGSSGALDSNELIHNRGESDYHPHSQHQHQQQSPPELNSRIDTILHSEEDDHLGGLEENDETKILKSKTTIIVPDRKCLPGQRRDPRGFCRTILRFMKKHHHFGEPHYGYYSRRYISVPTLHFILTKKK